jgi:hypothetical protein
MSCFEFLWVHIVFYCVRGQEFPRTQVEGPSMVRALEILIKRIIITNRSWDFFELIASRIKVAKAFAFCQSCGEA